MQQYTMVEEADQIETFKFTFYQDELADTFYDTCISVEVTVNIHPILTRAYNKAFDDDEDSRKVAEWLADVVVIQDTRPDGISPSDLQTHFKVVNCNAKEY